MSNVAELLTIGEISRRSGVASSALRFYEERSLIASERSGSGHRRYPRAVLRRIAFIVFAQRIGLRLDEIGDELAKLPPHHAPTRGDWSRLSATWSSRIDERIAELRASQARLTECMAAAACRSVAAPWQIPEITRAASGRARATGWPHCPDPMRMIAAARRRRPRRGLRTQPCTSIVCSTTVLLLALVSDRTSRG